VRSPSGGGKQRVVHVDVGCCSFGSGCHWRFGTRRRSRRGGRGWRRLDAVGVHPVRVGRPHRRGPRPVVLAGGIFPVVVRVPEELLVVRLGALGGSSSSSLLLLLLLLRRCGCHSGNGCGRGLLLCGGSGLRGMVRRPVGRVRVLIARPSGELLLMHALLSSVVGVAGNTGRGAAQRSAGQHAHRRLLGDDGLDHELDLLAPGRRTRNGGNSVRFSGNRVGRDLDPRLRRVLHVPYHHALPSDAQSDVLVGDLWQ
jgi:hypothetical protein